MRHAIDPAHRGHFIQPARLGLIPQVAGEEEAVLLVVLTGSEIGEVMFDKNTAQEARA